MNTAFDPATLQLWLQAHPHWVFAAIGGIAFIESFAILGIVVPGVALIGAAAFAAGAVPLAIAPCLIAACAGAITGDGVSYLLGRVYHADIKRAWPFRTNPRWIGDGEAFFSRHGAWSVALGRFVGPIRPVIPLVAGILSMPARRFLLINVLSAFAWAPVYVLPGYWLGSAVDREIAPAPLLIGAAVVLAGIVGALLWRRRHRRAVTVTTPDEENRP